MQAYGGIRPGVESCTRVTVKLQLQQSLSNTFDVKQVESGDKYEILDTPTLFRKAARYLLTCMEESIPARERTQPKSCTSAVQNCLLRKLVAAGEIHLLHSRNETPTG